MIIRLAHLCFRTNRFDEMTRFYQETLGLPIKFSLRLPDGTVFGHYFALGETSFLELFDQKGAVAMWGGENLPPKNHPDGTFNHMCLQVTNIDDLRNGLVAKNVAAREIITGVDNSRQTWIKDPDGNDIELMEYTDKSLQVAL
jgi:catechol 2,3-dioxygenase-like lactoylglutathione lyase family enzyme